MRTLSFEDILKSKIKQEELSLENDTKSHYKEFWEAVAPIFTTITHKSSRFPYAKKSMRNIDSPVVMATNEIQKEKYVNKSDLNDSELSVWNLFELTFDTNLGTKSQPKIIKKIFRQFALNHHPDKTQSTTTVDFSFVVKIKDEMLALLDKKLVG